MTKNNGIPIEVNNKSFETVQELQNKYEVPSFEEFMENYKYDENINYDDLTHSDISDKGKGYGPCKNTLCGCSCSSNKCVCASAKTSLYKEPEFKAGFFATSGRGKAEQNFITGSGQVGGSLFRIKDSKRETRLFSASIGGDIGANPAAIDNLKLKLGVNIIEHKSDGVEARLGLNVDTGGSINSDGVEAKFLGFGISAGKKNGISTPLGGISVDKDDCVVQ